MNDYYEVCSKCDRQYRVISSISYAPSPTAVCGECQYKQEKDVKCPRCGETHTCSVRGLKDQIIE